MRNYNRRTITHSFSSEEASALEKKIREKEWENLACLTAIFTSKVIIDRNVSSQENYSYPSNRVILQLARVLEKTFHFEN